MENQKSKYAIRYAQRVRIEQELVKFICKRASFRQVDKKFKDGIRASEIAENKLFIIRNLNHLFDKHGANTENSRDFTKWLSRYTYKEINDSIRIVFGKLINVKHMDKNDIEKANDFFKLKEWLY